MFFEEPLYSKMKRSQTEFYAKPFNKEAWTNLIEILKESFIQPL